MVRRVANRSSEVINGREIDVVNEKALIQVKERTQQWISP
ncbi:restriction endonuclease fold toxin [Chromobacterium sp.]